MTPSRKPIAISLLAGILPWPAVYAGLYLLHDVWAAFALYYCVCLLAWSFLRPQRQTDADARWNGRHAFALAARCAFANAAAYLCAGVFTRWIHPAHLSAALLRLHAIGTPEHVACLFAVFGIVNPVVEEMFWRAALYAGLRASGWDIARSTAASALLFGAWHWLPLALLLPPLAARIGLCAVVAAGIELAVLYERSRSLGAIIAAHAFGADIPLLVLLWLEALRR